MAPHVKSQPIPEKNDGPVTVVVGHSFNDLVLNANKNGEQAGERRGG